MSWQLLVESDKESPCAVLYDIIKCEDVLIVEFAYGDHALIVNEMACLLQLLCALNVTLAACHPHNNIGFNKSYMTVENIGKQQ